MTHCIIQNTNITIIETKIISLIYSEAVCTIQEGCTANGIKKKQSNYKISRKIFNVNNSFGIHFIDS